MKVKEISCVLSSAKRKIKYHNSSEQNEYPLNKKAFRRALTPALFTIGKLSEQRKENVWSDQALKRQLTFVRRGF